MNYFSEQGRGTPMEGSRLKLSKKVFVITLFLFVFGCQIGVFAQKKGKIAVTNTQQTALTGVVKDETGNPIVGASIKIKGTTTGVISDIDGNFRIPNLISKTTIIISYIGYKTTEAVIDPGVRRVILLEETSTTLNDIVVVGFGTQKKISVTGSVVSVSAKEMLKSPVGNPTQALAGRISGITTVQSSGQPGKDDVDIRVRGRGTFNDNGALTLVDGIERPFNQLDMNEIESVTVLKDAASTAVYGVRGANGVILVTTKKGSEGPAKVSYSGNFSIQQPTRLPEYANSYDYARLWNEAEKNDTPTKADNMLTYKPADLQKYQDGSDPLFYPNTNWYNTIMRASSAQQKHNVNISGGTKVAKYYVSLGFLTQDGLYKNFNEQYGYNNNDSYRRFNLRTNIDVNLTKTTVLSFNVGTRSGVRSSASDGGNNVYTNIPVIAPNLSPGMWDNKIIYLSGLPKTGNLIYNLSLGYAQSTENALESNFGINQNLDFITKGLSAKAKYSYDTNYSYSISQSRTPAIYVPSRVTVNGRDTVVYKLNNSQDESLGGLSNIAYGSRSMKEYLESSINYDRSFGKHNITALFLYNQSKWRYHGRDFGGVPVAYTGIVGRVTYNYDWRYLLEFNLGHNGSENFPAGKRFGWFPALSAGWVVSREPFFEKLISTNIISHLKLRASYGEVGNDRMGSLRFLYLPASYTSGTGAGSWFGENFTTPGNMTEQKLGNPYITWEKAKKENYGVELKLFNDKLSANFDYFYENRNDILAQQNTIPAMFAAVPEVQNLGKMENRGFEIELGWDETIHGFNYFLKGNYSFSRNKLLYKDEVPDPLNPQLTQTGRRVEQTYGYQFLGFFKDANDVAQSPTQIGNPRPGDCKYADINGDGIVNDRDRMPIGYPTYPEVSFGLSGGLSYKGFDFSFLFQGSTNVSLNIQGFMQKPFDSGGNILQSAIEERWTTQTANTAKQPQLTIAGVNGANYYTSTLWSRDASYLRLKNMEIGYKFTGSILRKVGVSGMRIFANGQNLITWDKLKIVDPENGRTGNLSYPQVKIFNLGLNFQF